MATPYGDDPAAGWDITGDLELSGDHSTTLIYTDLRLSGYKTNLELTYAI